MTDDGWPSKRRMEGKRPSGMHYLISRSAFPEVWLLHHQCVYFWRIRSSPPLSPLFLSECQTEFSSCQDLEVGRQVFSSPPLDPRESCRVHHPSASQCTVLMRRMPHRKWRECKQQLRCWPDFSLLCCSFVSLHFLWGILHTGTVHFY